LARGFCVGRQAVVGRSRFFLEPSAKRARVKSGAVSGLPALFCLRGAGPVFLWSPWFAGTCAGRRHSRVKISDSGFFRLAVRALGGVRGVLFWPPRMLFQAGGRFSKTRRFAWRGSGCFASGVNRVWRSAFVWLGACSRGRHNQSLNPTA